MLLSARRDGQVIWYAISSAPAREIAQTLYRAYCMPSPVNRALRGAVLRKINERS
jgi:hypothetical protein